MYEKFTDRAKKVLQLASHETHRLNHEYVATEHILVGLIREGAGVGSTVLHDLGVTTKEARRQLEVLSPPGPARVSMGRMSQTPRAKKVIEFAIEEARNLKHNYVGTEHLLLGLLKEQGGTAATILRLNGIDMQTVKNRILELILPPPKYSSEHRALANAVLALEKCAVFYRAGEAILTTVDISTLNRAVALARGVAEKQLLND